MTLKETINLEVKVNADVEPEEHSSLLSAETHSLPVNDRLT